MAPLLGLLPVVGDRCMSYNFSICVLSLRLSAQLDGGKEDARACVCVVPGDSS